MANVGFVTDAHIQQWDEWLNAHPLLDVLDEWLDTYPLIDRDSAKWKIYGRLIHMLSPKEKGSDLGVAIFIADAIQGASVPAPQRGEANRILAEVSHRMLAHLTYIKEVYQMDFIDPKVQVDPTSKLIEMAQYVMKHIILTEEMNFTEIGIKGVTFISDEILD